MTWRLHVFASSSSRMKNRGDTGPKVSHVLSSSAFCEKEQSGREREREREKERASVEVGERGVTRRRERKKKEQKETKEPGESRRYENRRSSTRRKRVYAYTRARTCNTVTHRRIVDGACTRVLCMQRPLVNARVRLLRAGKSSRSRGRPMPESRILFYERPGPRTRVF